MLTRIVSKSDVRSRPLGGVKRDEVCGAADVALDEQIGQPRLMREFCTLADPVPPNISAITALVRLREQSCVE